MDALSWPKNSQLLHEARLKYSEQHYKLCRLQIPNRNKVKNPRTNSIFESLINFKGVQTFWENLIYSPKFCIYLIFTKVNLVEYTCMQENQVPHKCQKSLV
jgi:hypothetical protein